jgi:pyridoxamine 5'-phosphate oxidase
MPGMDFDHPPSDPVALFRAWLADAEKTGLLNPNAMTLATVDPDGRPSARIVLLKELDERGAVFYTNRQSRKGLALAANPRATLLFYWDALGRQVRIDGDVTLVSDAESDAYWATRPRMSQISAWASHQSRPARNRAELDAAAAQIQRRFSSQPNGQAQRSADQAIPRPPHWGGYRVTLNAVEFWQGHPFRLHDRVVYTSNGRGGWTTQRLWP